MITPRSVVQSLCVVLTFLALAAFATQAQAQNNFVYVNNQAASNTVSAYRVSATGSLSAVSGSPFATGGVGANVVCFGLDRIVLSPVNNLLFVANTGDRTISAFQINPTSGALTRTAGSPVASGLTLDSCQGISLAATPDGKFLMASSNGQIQTFSVAPSGALTLLATTPTCCQPNAGMVISPNGQFLAISNQTSVSMFLIDASTGALTPVLGSPFPKTGTGSLSGLDFSCAADRLYGGEATGTPPLTDAWTVDPTGVLTPVPGTPFKGIGNNSNIVLLSPDNSLLFQSNQSTNSVNSFHVSADGSLSGIGKFGGVGTVHIPAGMATDQSGTFLFVADDSFGVAVFRIGDGGTLSSVQDLGINRPGEIQDLVAFPPRSCTTTDLALAMTAAPNPVAPGGSISYVITITNNGTVASSAVISDSLPAGTSPGGSAKIVVTTGASRAGGVVTITTTAPHGLTLGQKATVTGVVNSSFNGTFVVTSIPGPNSFTYNQALADATSGSGSITFPVCSVTGTGNTCGGAGLARFVTFPSLAPGETQTATLVVTTSGSALNGSLISNTANISNKSAIDPNPADNSVTAVVTVGTQAPTALTVPTATGPYGGSATLSATLTNKTTNATLAGKTILFNFNQTNDTFTAVTDANGIASVIVPLDLTTVGTHPSAFTASFAGDASFSASSSVGTLIVTKAQLTVTADSQSRLYGDANPPLTYTITGFVNGDTAAVVSGAATCSTTTTQTSPAGNYPISCTLGTLAAQNYVFVFVDGTLTVNPAPLTVTVANASRAYGAANPTFTGSITGLKNGDVITATYSTTATPASPVGTYPITATLVDPSGVLGNYVVTNNPGTLTVTAAALVVTANNATRLYGDPNPSFTGTIAGLVNGDNITATYTTVATPASPVGNYPIVPALNDPANKLGNYAVTLNNGNLVVSPAPLTVTAANATRAFGAPNPVFTGTIVGIKNGDNITATYASPATPASAPGTYPIIPTLADPTGKLGNYSVTLNNGTLTITAAVLTVTADNASRLYGDPNPAFTGTITGLVNGDNITATYASVADPTSPVGTYAIVPTLVDPNGKLVNYTVVSNNGTLTVNPAPLTVTAANASRAYGAANPAFSGTITGIKNGDNITATYASVAAATSNVGTYPIVPTLVDPTGKLGNYTVTSNNGTLTITPAPLTVTAANASRLYGDPNPAFTGTITGLLNGDNITATYSSADPTAAVGTYPIVPALVDPTGKLGNYTVTSNNGTLTITPAPLSVSAANATRAFGDSNPSFTGTITGTKNSDNITATYSTTATATSPVGTYPIVPALVDPTGKLGNYTVTSNNGTLTITQSVLTVTAANASMIFGDSVPALSGTITGLKNGDTISATYSTTATSASPVGTYAIAPTLVDPGNQAVNYTVLLNNGTLTISPAPLTVTAANASRLYGDPNPAFTGSVTGLKNGDSIGATFSAAASPTSPVGTYAIIPALVDPSNQASNYTVTINNGILTVAPAPLSVVANSTNRLYGDPNPAFTGTITGIRNGDNITATYSSIADPTSPVGTYPIVPALVDPTNKLANYVVTSTNGTLTVDPAPLTIQAADATKLAGDPNPTFTGTITGLKNADVVTASYSSPADATSPAGTYPIIPSADPNPVLSNYSVALFNGTLTIQ